MDLTILYVMIGLVLSAGVASISAIYFMSKNKII